MSSSILPKDIPFEMRKGEIMTSEAAVLASKIEMAKREWEAIFDALAFPIYTHDIDMVITRANKAFAEFIGVVYLLRDSCWGGFL